MVKKSTSEIKQADATGKARTIQVEVRKSAPSSSAMKAPRRLRPAAQAREAAVEESAVSRRTRNWFAARKKPAARLS